jgi:hypothetical protein
MPWLTVILIIVMPPPTLGVYFVVLEIDPSQGLSPDVVRRQYRCLSELFNPEYQKDRGSEFVEFVRKRRDAVRAAAEALLGSRGEKLIDEQEPAKTQELRPNAELESLFGV